MDSVDLLLCGFATGVISIHSSYTIINLKNHGYFLGKTDRGSSGPRSSMRYQTGRTIPTSLGKSIGTGRCDPHHFEKQEIKNHVRGDFFQESTMDCRSTT